MYARVWKFNLFPDKVEQFETGCRSVLALNRKRPGCRGLVVLQGGLRDVPEATVVSLWDSLEDLRASESEAFQQAVAKVMVCCKSGAVLREEEVLICELDSAKKQKPKPKPKPKKKKGRARRRAS